MNRHRAASAAAAGTGPPAITAGTDGSAAPTAGRSLKTAWDTFRAGVGAVLGLVPHVLHHVGLLAGSALLTGVAGNLALFGVGLALSIPLLRRLYRHFHGWAAPAVAVVVFAALYAVSAFVIGPAISGTDTPPPATPSVTPSAEHSGHH